MRFQFIQKYCAYARICLNTPFQVQYLLFNLHTLEPRHVTHYNKGMIKTFADKATQSLYLTGKSRRFPPDIHRRAIRKLEYVNLAIRLDDLKVPPGNRLHELTGDRQGQHAICVNDQWRICFRFAGQDAYEVELTDYH